MSISNPDLPFRLQRGLPLQSYNPDTFYVTFTDKVYTQYTFNMEFLEAKTTAAD
ncbi:uncharacterized protein LDX57_001362 [Aspergillus melleus]|uniref:uncharacterized protein n=1 Tax=Aspergillus melleus TaxID=138277 RepID=UPI001E8ECBA4|nr:uncharacterized protein LDX57_001362 [Aspergillus melleus]KAH8423602.1 hypothetical protein LDX57_001362 [Aspergillus melleus]